MIQKLIIRPIREKGETVLIGQYLHGHKNELWSVVGDGRKFVSGEPHEKDRVFRRNLTKDNPYVFVWDDTNSTENLIADFWKNHNQIKPVAGENVLLRGVPQFTLEIASQVIGSQHEEITKKIEIANRVLVVDFEEKRNLMFALGRDPREMTHQEMNIVLIGKNLDGLAIEYRREFEQFFNANSRDQQILAYVNKAIKLGVIRYVDNVYKNGGNILGVTIQEVFLYMKGDKETFEKFLIPEVDKNLKYSNISKDDVDADKLPVEVEIQEEKIRLDTRAPKIDPTVKDDLKASKRG